jgi:hypothetical protein
MRPRPGGTEVLNLGLLNGVELLELGAALLKGGLLLFERHLVLLKLGLDLSDVRRSVAHRFG